MKGPFDIETQEVKRLDDQEIISLYNQRNEQAIVVSQMKYGIYCQSIAYNILRQTEDSEECVNDTWMHTWNAIPPDQPGNLKAYLGKITRNLALNRYRDRHSLKHGGGNVDFALSELRNCIAGDPTPEEALLDGILEEAINRFLDGLPKEKRTGSPWNYCGSRSCGDDGHVCDSLCRL